MCNEVLAKELFATATVVAVSTQFGIICYHTISDLETVNSLAKCCNYTYSFMTGDKRKLSFVVSNIKSESSGLTDLGSKFTIVNVQVCTADSRGIHFNLHRLLDMGLSNLLLTAYQNVLLTNFWKSFLNDTKLSSLAVLYILIPRFSPVLSNTSPVENITNPELASKEEDQKKPWYT